MILWSSFDFWLQLVTLAEEASPADWNDVATDASYDFATTLQRQVWAELPGFVIIKQSFLRRRRA
ncbi:hypothetical protein PHLCEN_2v3765 [Hermanssonia centrifuga]|uniref:Uncharacterized protein n=1 Tax=Hermanssonia centrifuga TaxID=98765 RepID=A0A2R6QBG9_9APHY|nr:hypothetical protein PHLCEN_2v3765 [Hermanssonia centrifuga]